jgi:hypothetical protein
MPRGKPFVKDDPRRGKSSGRPKKSVNWKAAEELLREALPRVLSMERNELRALLESNPTGAEMLAAKFLHEEPTKAVERFLGKMPTVLTGAEGAPLIPAAPAPVLPPLDFTHWTPAQIDKFIERTGATTAPPAAPPPPTPPTAAPLEPPKPA